MGNALSSEEFEMKEKRNRALSSLATGIIVGILLGSVATFIYIDYSQKNINLYSVLPSILTPLTTTSSTQYLTLSQHH